MAKLISTQPGLEKSFTNDQIIGAGHQANGFDFVEFFGGGVRYNTHNPSLPPQVDIYAGILERVEHYYGPVGSVVTWFTPPQTTKSIECPPVVIDPPVGSVPEPSYLAMVGLVMIGLVLWRRNGYALGRMGWK